jgi:hypothetical protein
LTPDDDTYPNGYYWAHFPNGAGSGNHVVYREGENWWVVGIAHPIDFDPVNIIAPAIDPLSALTGGMTVH